MSGLGSESATAISRERPWNMYTSSDPNPPQLAVALAAPPRQRDLDSSMSAISFGFAATAILISMFLIMAIFEHLFKPGQPDEDLPARSSSSSGMQKHPISTETDSTLCMSGFSVVMPGHQGPTHIAKPAPLPAPPPPPPPPCPCSREGIKWPQH